MRRNTNNTSRLNILRRTAKEVKQYRVTKKILITASILLALVIGLIYTISALYKKTGSFTVSVNKYEMTRVGLSLSERRDGPFNNSYLNADIDKEMTNIAGATLPENLDQIDGEHNGDNYIAYTFYLQNAGDVKVSCKYQVKMSNISQDLDEAIRLRLYVDGTPTTYAKTASDGSGAEPGTTSFPTATIMAEGRIDGFDSLAVTRFTVVIWIEGPDPDCVDWLIGGRMKIDMDIEITE